ncbi:MAG: 2-oxoacid:acceptor oxidoreductase subunit alpha [Clostridiales bacterium]
MDYNILIGGSAGQGMETISSILEKILQKRRYEIFTTRDYMSRIRGGHNFIQIRFSIDKITSHSDKLDLIVALNEETIDIHKKRLKNKGIIIGEKDFNYNDKKFMGIPLNEISKKIGNLRVKGSIAVGSVLKLFGFNNDFIMDILKKTFKKDELITVNMNAIEEGFNCLEKIFDVPKGNSKDKILINGNESIALGAIAANCKFYSAYPMTPSTSIMTYIASKMEEAQIVVEQAEDEIAAINMAIGASYAGVRAMTGTSGGGFALKVEGLGLAAMLETPLVIAEVQRPGPTTGFPTRTEQSDLKFIITSAQGEFPRMVISVKHPEDAFFQTVRAFNLADKYQIPVVIMNDQFLADYTTTVDPFDIDKVTRDRYIDNFIHGEYVRYKITKNGVSPRIIPGKIKDKLVLVDSDEHDESGHITESAEDRVKMNDKRMRKLDYLKDELIEPDFFGNKEADILLLGWGSMHGPLKEAVKELNILNIKTKALVFGDIWPLPTKLIQNEVKGINKIINVEQNATGQLNLIIKEVLCVSCTDSILKYDGRQLSAGEIVDRVKNIIKLK